MGRMRERRGMRDRMWMSKRERLRVISKVRGEGGKESKRKE